MKYIIDIDYYTSGGYSHTTTVDSGHCEEIFSLSEYMEENDIQTETENGWCSVTVNFYEDQASPFYDDPIHTETANQTL